MNHPVQSAEISAASSLRAVLIQNDAQAVAAAHRLALEFAPARRNAMPNAFCHVTKSSNFQPAAWAALPCRASMAARGFRMQRWPP